MERLPRPCTSTARRFGWTASATQATPLVEISQVWQPDAAGDYVLQVVATDPQGNEGRSNTVRIHIGDLEPLSPEIPETQAPASTSSPDSSTPSNPTFTFNTNANCRGGPSTQYQVEASFQEGQSAQIDGRNQAQTGWWWVLRSNGAHCWVSDTTGTASGPTGNVQFVDAPPPPVVIVPTDTDTPPPVQTAPNAPSSLAASEQKCDSTDGYIVKLTWKDNANNEEGYRVYHNGNQIANLGANVTQFTTGDLGTGFEQSFYVVAYNSGGTAQSNTGQEDGCFF